MLLFKNGLFVTEVLEQPASETLVHNDMVICLLCHSNADKQRKLIITLNNP